jgi:hypothetical protein
MKETELAEKFIDFFDKFEIYKEVPAHGIIDFVAKSGPVTIAVEVKVSLNFDVIDQANKNKMYCTYSYIAVPRPKHYHFGYDICKMLGVGVIVYYEHPGWKIGYITEQVAPAINRDAGHKWLRLKLEPYMMRSVAGSQNDRVTAFGNTVDEITNYIQRHPGCHIKDCLNDIKHHYGSLSSARSCITHWCNAGIIKQFRIEKGKMFINDVGNTDIITMIKNK